MTFHEYQACIDSCLRCAQECERTATACLEEEAVPDMARCIRLSRDCAAMCSMAAAAMSSESEFSRSICRLCADICTACAASCEEHDAHQCQRCAAACLDCAEECAQVAGAAEAMAS